MSTSADQQTVDALRRSVASLEEKNERLSRALSTARGQLVQLNEKIHRSQQPPHTLVSVLAVDTAARQIDAMVGTKHMRLTVDSSVDLSTVAVGQLVRLNENMVVVGVDHFERTGTLTSVLEVLGADRVLVSLEGGAEQVLTLAGPLRHGSVRAGDSVMANLRAGQAIERVTRSDVEQLLTPQVPDVTYDDIGGLDQQLASVRDSIEMPLRHPQLYRDYGLRPPKGILLYGPPGSGKTLIAKAVANALSQTESGVRGHFLSIKGPELLNKFVGETERQIRAIFSRARALAATGIPVVVFFDEMEALFRTRGAGISSDVETMIVPQLLAEMDGVEALDNVIIIGASNRADMIDPAVLRPGRLDVRIRIDRPDRTGARDIFTKYLTTHVPIAASEISRYGSHEEALNQMIDAAVKRLYARDQSTALFHATLTSGAQTTLYLSDIVSGALIASSVERAKKHAIRATLGGSEQGLSQEHVLRGVEEEMRESMELAATSSPVDWARTVGVRDDIQSVTPIQGDPQ